MDSNKKKITHFKTPAEIAARKAFIAGADAALAGNKWDTADLKRLSTEDLLDRLEKIDNQATLMRWRIWWAIRQQFKSDKLFGQYIISLKENAHYAHLIGNQQDINRALNAGKFCEAHGITDLDAIGLLKSSIYALSRPANADVADSVFNAAKRKNLPNTEVERMVYEAKSITVEKEPAVERLEHGFKDVHLGPRTVQVLNNIAQIPEVLDVVTLGEEIEEVIERKGHTPATVIERRVSQEGWDPSMGERRVGLKDRRFSDWVDAVKPEYRTFTKHPQIDLKNVDYDDLLLELSSRDASGITEDQKISEMVLLDERFKMSAIKLIGLHTNAIRQHQEMVYGKK